MHSLNTIKLSDPTPKEVHAASLTVCQYAESAAEAEEFLLMLGLLGDPS